MTASFAWRNAVALTDSKTYIYGNYFDEKGFVVRLPIELVARFQSDYRPSARIPIRIGKGFFGHDDADPVPGNMLRALQAHISDACKAGELAYKKELLSDDSHNESVQITSQDFAKWLAANKMQPSVHIQAWFDETGITFSKPQSIEEKPLATRERNTLLAIIATLCKEAKIDYTKPAKAAGQIMHTADIMGLQIGETTIERHLKKIPDALGTRMK